MTHATARPLYLVLLRLHPRGFRLAFAGEMLRVFDDASARYGAAWLLGDAVLSLLRQRLLREPEEASLSESRARLGLLAGSYPEYDLPHLTTGKLSLALVLSLTSFLLFPPGVPTKDPVRSHGAGHRLEVRHEFERRS